MAFTLHSPGHIYHKCSAKKEEVDPPLSRGQEDGGDLLDAGVLVEHVADSAELVCTVYEEGKDSGIVDVVHVVVLNGDGPV